MQRSSSSIASLAAALAKAQIALVNSEKSLVATIRQGGASGVEQTFRYAPLSSGLEIVRKTLGEHEIATVQTTAIDQGGIVNLTTVLAHSSGEWIASDWPVCSLSETATPHRMGAALTYARRYALFTLVGIAGEDDLDAPNLQTPTSQAVEPPRTTGQGDGRLNGGAAPPSRRRKAYPTASKPILGSVQSAELRERLLAELSRLISGEDAAMWAHRSLPEKNRLTAADAQTVERAFQTRMAAFTTYVDEFDQRPARVERPEVSPGTLPDSSRVPSGKRLRAKRIAVAIDKGALALPEQRRVRDRDHVRYVAKQPCLICGRQPSDAHHLRFAQSRALGRKVSDEFTVPLCRGHHRECHRCGDEAAWWSAAGIEPTSAARALWLKTNPLPARAEKTIEEDLTSSATVSAGLRNGRGDPPVGKPTEIDETKPFPAAGA
jgi:hypothetical protein